MGHPTVEVALLFTDIEGSTALAHELGDDYVDLLAQHNRIVRDAIGRFTGVEARNEGDAFFAAFDNAVDAVRAALEMQRALSTHAWSHGRPVRVRMGIHVGAVIRLLHDFAGLNVHLASRISSAAHGGQVVASQAALHALDSDAAFEWLALGDHLVKDFPEPITLYQLRAEGLDETFPPLNTIDARDNNLPAMVTSFVGRSDELTELRTLLSGDARLVTLTGPGGVGKTRIAIEAAWSMLSRFRGGAWFVDFAPAADPRAVVDTIVGALGLRDRDHLRQTAAAPTLLVLDNLEHLLSGVVAISELLKDCPKLVVLATTRERLRLQGEHEVVLDGLAEADALDLFMARAALVRRDLEADDRVVTLCDRVGRLPLAIELAAARLRTQSIDALLAAMDDMLATLTEGERDRPARHQAMRAAIAVSVDALTEAERAVFRAFAVFAGGATVEAINAVCAPKADEIESLVDKSLLRRNDDRLTMLEPIRQFAEERLRADAPGEYEQRVQAHGQFFLDLAERLEPDLVTARQRDALERLGNEDANLRVATERGEGDVPLRMAAALVRFWIARGYTQIGREILRRELAKESSVDTAVRATAQLGAAHLALLQNDLAEARQLLAEADVAEFPSLRGTQHNLMGEAARRESDADTAEAEFANALRIGEACGDDRVVSVANNGQGTVALLRGDFVTAAEMFRRAADASERDGDLQLAMRSVGNLGVALMNVGDVAAATAAFERSLHAARQLRNRGAEASALVNLAWATQIGAGAEFHEADSTPFRVAGDYVRSAIEIFDELGYRHELASALMGVPAVAGDREEGLRALARAEGLMRQLGDGDGVARVEAVRRDFLESCD